MQKNDDVRAAVERYEAVEWLYDGLGGKVITWTKEHGNDHDDPSVLAWVADSDGNVIEKAANVGAPGAFAKWLVEQADAYERTHPTTRVPLVRATVTAEGEGEARTARCAELDEAREAGRPVLVYVGRGERPDDDKAAASDVKASRKLEKGTLGAKSAAEAAEGFVLLRLDVADPDHALLAKALGATEVPTLLLFAPKAEKAEDLGGKISGQALAHRLKRVTVPDDE